MPGRQAHGRPLLTSKPSGAAGNPQRKKSTSQSRNAYLDAFGLATEQVRPTRKRMRGDLIEDEPQQRRKGPARDGDDDEEGFDEEEDEDDQIPRKKRARKADEIGGEDGGNDDHGSDSEGHEWQLGGLMDDHGDEEIDSDDAFGESDEERFAGWTFSGSRSARNERKKQGSRDEGDDSEDEDDDEDEDDGENAMDMATLLDQVGGGVGGGTMGGEESGSEDGDEDGEDSGDEDEDADDDSEEEDDDGEDDEENEEDDDEDHEEKLTSLQGLVAGFAGGDGAGESRVGSSRQKVDFADLGLSGIRDVHMRQSVRLMKREERETRPGLTKKLDVPLAPRQQDRALRGAAYEKTKETLERWTETVKQQRRAEHIVFPLPQNVPSSGMDTTELPALDVRNSTSELEQTISSIMEQSGLSLAKQSAKRLKDGDAEAADAQLSVAELRAMVQQKRLRREADGRELKRAKRIKKIKSKAYHRVHRKDRERRERAEQEARLEAGEELSDEEREALDRQRALERVGARHRESKWAKAGGKVKRAVWDDEYRSGLVDMAKREQELLQRKEGRTAGSSEDDGDDSDDDDEGSGSEDEQAERKRLRRALEQAAGAGADDAEPLSKLMSLKFMQRAEAAQRKANDELVAELHRELASDEEDGDEKDQMPEEVGRKKFGIKGAAPAGVGSGRIPNPFSLPSLKPGKVGRQGLPVSISSGSVKPKRPPHKSAPIAGEDSVSQPSPSFANSTAGAWSQPGATRDKKKPSRRAAASAVAELDLSAFIITNESTVPKKKNTSSKSSNPPATVATTTTSARSDDDNDDDDDVDDAAAADIHLPLAIRDQNLIARAFAGEDVVATFAAEKARVAEDEDDKYIDNELPGWGGWAGMGIRSRKGKKDGQRNAKWVTKVEGVNKDKRRDAKLQRVIINEKQTKKNNYYLATQLPHPFETRQQYERSLRVPVGEEWVTKESFQDATKPRVLLKHGVIEPMLKPTV